jgi:hypothetical protein
VPPEADVPPVPPAADAPPAARRRDRRRRTLLFTALVAGLLLLGAVSYLVFGGDGPGAVEAEDAVAGLDVGGEAPADGGSGDAGQASADGTWTVDTELEPYDLAASTGSFVGYRIDEELASVGTTQAVGRTPAVAGAVTVAGTTISGLELTGDLRELVSDRPRRDGRVADALRVGEDPTVRFTAETFELPEDLADGERLEVPVPGTLAAAGGSTDVVADATAQRRGDVVVVTGSLDVALADLGITAPSAAIVLRVADTATIEWQLYLTRG